MSLVNLQLPIGSIERLLTVLTRIADALDRAYPPYADAELRYSEPTSGVSIVTNEMVLEEEMKVYLRAQGYKPDQIEEMENFKEGA